MNPHPSGFCGRRHPPIGNTVSKRRHPLRIGNTASAALVPVPASFYHIDIW
jgi:hypothetical protein